MHRPSSLLVAVKLTQTLRPVGDMIVSEFRFHIPDAGDFAVDYAQFHHGGTKFDNREDSDLCAIYHLSNDIDANFDGRGADLRTRGESLDTHDLRYHND